MAESQPHIDPPAGNAPKKETFWLTPQCRLIQSDLMELVESIEEAALGDIHSVRTSFLRALNEFRRRLRDHAAVIEGPAGLYGDIVRSAAECQPIVTTLCQQHQELDALLEILEQRFAAPENLAPEASVRLLRQSARELAALVKSHRETASALESCAAFPPIPGKAPPRNATEDR